jgi:hypothetical protein
MTKSTKCLSIEVEHSSYPQQILWYIMTNNNDDIRRREVISQEQRNISKLACWRRNVWHFTSSTSEPIMADSNKLCGFTSILEKGGGQGLVSVMVAIWGGGEKRRKTFHLTSPERPRKWHAPSRMRGEKEGWSGVCVCLCVCVCVCVCVWEGRLSKITLSLTFGLTQGRVSCPRGKGSGWRRPPFANEDQTDPATLRAACVATQVVTTTNW